jgi:hypothetical protein
MIDTPDSHTARGNESRPTRRKWPSLAAWAVYTKLAVAAGVLGGFVFHYMGGAKTDYARIDMKALETAFKSATMSSKNKEPNYPAGVIPFLGQGENALRDPWGGRYQMRMIQTGDGPRPQFFTFTPGGEEIVWPRQ